MQFACAAKYRRCLRTEAVYVCGVAIKHTGVISKLRRVASKSSAESLLSLYKGVARPIVARKSEYVRERSSIG